MRGESIGQAAGGPAIVRTSGRLLARLAMLFLLLALLLPVGLLAAPATPALAAGDITVTAARDENRYPTDARFYLEASSSADITRVVFNFQFVGSNASAYAYPEFTPGPQVQIEHRWDTRAKYVVPGSEMDYYWTIEDAAGGSLKTDPIHFVFDDTRFQWNSLQQDQITIMWYRGDDSFGQQILDAAVRAAQQLSQDAGLQSRANIKVMLYGTQRDMLGVLEQGAHEWTGGRSFSDTGIVVIAAGPDPSGLSFALRAVPHELSHAIIHRATDNPYSSLPQWLDEGLAMYAEGSQEGLYIDSLNRAIRDNKLISLRSLSSNFPADSAQATLSYAESYSVVKYIIDKYGREGMGKLLQVFSQGSTPDRALQQALGVNQAGLEAEWRASIGAGAAAGTTAGASSGSASAAETTPADKRAPSGQGRGGVLVPSSVLVTVGGGILVVVVATAVLVGMRVGRKRA